MEPPNPVVAVTPENPGGLRDGELFWRDRYDWLRESGYLLRTRYSPAWKPSWLGTSKSRFDCADGIALRRGQIIDATQISTGSLVAIKRIFKSSFPYEEELFQYLSTEPLSSDPRNHCIQLIEALHPPEDENLVLLVMPLLRSSVDPAFETIGEAVECFRQIFEGVQFMHEHRVAHRDINYTNIMMNAKNMFPNGYHLQSPKKNTDLSGPAKFLTRTERPPSYFLIDFGLSRKYDTIDDCQEDIIVGGNKTVPEFQKDTFYHNPFQTDVYCTGDFIRQIFLEGHPLVTFIRGYNGFGFMKPLIDDMVQEDPTKRPTMDEVVKRFDVIVNGLSQWKLRQRAAPRRQNIFSAIKHSIRHWKRRISFIRAGTPAIPRTQNLR